MRVLNKLLRQIEVIKFCRNNKVVVCGLIETRVKQNKALDIRRKFGHTWCFADNYIDAVNGRIWVGWDSNIAHFQKLSSSAQTVHGKVNWLNGAYRFEVMFIYGKNDAKGRLELWRELQSIHLTVHGPCLILGDFNNVLSSADRVSGLPVSDPECAPFRDTICDLQLS